MIEKDKEKDVLSHLRLMLHIQQPSHEECWIEGYKAAESGEEEEGNPYAEAGTEHSQWLEGWWAGFYGEEELYRLAVEKDFQGALQADQIRVDRAQASEVKQPQTLVTEIKATKDKLADLPGYFTNLIKVTSAIAATFLISYGLFDFLA